MNPPAFQFYADDFIAGTMILSQAEVGAYIRLLCYQWNRGSIPVEPEKQHRLAGGSVSVDVLAKFRLCEDGLLRNDRLEEVRARQQAFSDAQRAKGLKSGESRKPRFNPGSTPVEPDGQPEGQPKLNPPSPSPSPKERKKRGFEIPTIEHVRFLAQKAGMPEVEADKFFYHYDSKGWKVGNEGMKSLGSAIGGWATRWRAEGGDTLQPTRPKLKPNEFGIMPLPMNEA